MLKFYYHPLSPIARRVWLSLLEKQLPFEPIVVNLATGEQMQADYLALHPFHHVPAIVDGEIQVIESLAILDYLEAQYPEPSLTASSSLEVARMRMVQMVVVNEIVPKIGTLAAVETPDADLLQHMETALKFLSQQLGTGTYFGGDRLNLADIVAGATLPLVKHLGISFLPHPTLAEWHDRIAAREAWQKTEPSEADFIRWRRYVQLMVQRQSQTR